MPVPLAVASYASYASAAADGFSYASTGKSVTDHGVSYVMKEDCALWRGLVDGRICIEEAGGNGKTGPAVGVAYSARAGTSEARIGPIPESLAFDFGTKRPAPMVQKAALPSPGAEEDVAASAAQAPGTYLVLASFPDLLSARDLVEQRASLSPAIMSADVKGRHYYRVIVGPFKSAETRAVRAQLAAAGHDDIWLLTI